METLGNVCGATVNIVTDGYKGLYGLIIGKVPEAQPLLNKPAVAIPQVQNPSVFIRVLGNTSPWVRLAGLSGAIAVSMGAYGAHGLKNVTDSQREVFETANRYHFIHTLALLAVPLTHRPNVVGTLLVVGTLGFSGTCYVHGITGNNEIIKYTPYGGMTLIAAWLAMIF